MIILLDLDGVLVDFVRGSCDLLNISYDELLKRWPAGDWNYYKNFAVTTDQFYETINGASEDFWANLPEYPDARELYEFCSSLAPTYFCTAGVHSPASHSGKVRWLQKWMNDPDFDNFVLTRHKYLCARPDALLIDDADYQVDNFNRDGGKGVLIPRHWNTAYKWESQSLSVVKGEVIKWLDDGAYIETTSVVE